VHFDLPHLLPVTFFNEMCSKWFPENVRPASRLASVEVAR
jgi:hypothetical protein